jgi:AraC-like DNA-binding protein
MGVIYCNKIEEPILVSEPHSHDVWEIILRLKGNAKFQIGEQIYDTIPGDVFAIPPKVIHSGYSSEPYTDIAILVDNVDFSEGFLAKDDDKNIEALMEIIHKVLKRKEMSDQDIANAVWKAIYQCLKKNLVVNYKYAFVKELINTIDNNIINCDFNVSVAIHEMGYQADYVRKCFLEEVGTTPVKYLTLLRINQAKEVLRREPNISIEETAFRCGFRDSFYFSRVFKKYTGLSPLQYKRRNSLEN